METKLAGALWGLSVLFQLATILVTSIWALIARNAALFSLMGRSIVLTAFTGSLCLIAMYSDPFWLGSVGQSVVVGMSAVNLLLVGTALPKRVLGPLWLRVLSSVAISAVVLLQLVGGIASAAGAEVPLLAQMGRYGVVGIVAGLYVLASRHRSVYLFFGGEPGSLPLWKRLLENAPMVLFPLDILGVFQPWNPGDIRFFSFAALSSALVPAIAVTRSATTSNERPNTFHVVHTIARLQVLALPFVLFDALVPAPFHPFPHVFPFILVLSLVMFAVLMHHSLRSAFGRHMTAQIEPELSHRQSEVAGLLARGLTYGEIAAQLFISSETVKSHAKAVYEKYGVAGRAALRRRFDVRPH